MRLIALAVTLLFSTAAFAQEADLGVVASPGYMLDGSLHLETTVSNAGPDDVSDLDVLIQFDTARVTASSLDAACTGSSIGVVCSYSQLDSPVVAAGSEFVIELDLNPEAGAGDVEITVSSSVTDPDEGNNSDSFATIAPTTVDLSLAVRGIDAGARKSLVFLARNDGPDDATRVRVSGTVTVSFDELVNAATAGGLTGMGGDDGALCGRQVPEVDDSLDRWTFPVSCSLPDLVSGDEVQFHFWFEHANNAQFRLDLGSAALEANDADNTPDGDYLNSSIEVVQVDSDGGCCATASGSDVSWPVVFLMGAALHWRRRL